MIFNCNFI